jgi:hypothetical protein
VTIGEPIFHIFRAATTCDVTTSAMGSKPVKLRMSIFSALSLIAKIRAVHRLRTQGRHVQ